jgi:DNA polymerase (family 10)
VSLVVVAPGAYGAAVQDHSGHAHCMELRRYALRQRRRLHWGLRRKRVPFLESLLYVLTTSPPREIGVLQTEEQVYESLGLAWIPPSAREGKGEVQAAAAAFSDTARMKRSRQRSETRYGH